MILLGGRIPSAKNWQNPGEANKAETIKVGQVTFGAFSLFSVVKQLLLQRG